MTFDIIVHRPVGVYTISYASGKEPSNAIKEIPYLNDSSNPTAISAPTATLPYIEGLEPKDATGKNLNLCRSNLMKQRDTFFLQ